MNHQLGNAHFQTGLTLVELMVSLAIGLILMGGMVQVLSTNKNAYRYNVGVAEMQSNGAYALEFVASQIAQIGYVPIWSDYAGAGQNRIALETWAYGATPPALGTEGGGTVSDSIVIRVFADPLSPAATDCVGNVIKAGDPDTFVGPPGFGITNTLVIKIDAGRSVLTCNGVEIAEGIENLQIDYGVDTANPALPAPFDYDGQVDQYLAFDQIPPAERMNIVSARIALLVASTEQTRSAENSKTYDLLGASVSPGKDRKLRSVFTKTIRLNNRCTRFTGSGSTCV